jgi:hypothetical protein
VTAGKVSADPAIHFSRSAISSGELRSIAVLDAVKKALASAL